MRNKFEQRIHKQLTKAGVEFKYEEERIPYYLARHYIPDFIIKTATGKIYIECKGYFRPEHKAKMIAVKKLNPQMDLRILFYAPNIKNERWAVKNGFKYAVDTIPDEWLIGL